MLGELVFVNVGKPLLTEYKGKELRTGIYKQPVHHEVFVGVDNIDEDMQADLVNHGGADKAVCVYPYEHYEYWAKMLHKDLNPGAFGENFTVKGLLEDGVCIGDRFEIGEALFEVSLPRQPCFKLAKKFGVEHMPQLVTNTGFSGYYLRVLQEGKIKAGTAIKLVERKHSDITVSFVNNIKYHDRNNIEGIKKILAVDELSEGWRKSFEKRLLKN
ncbi:MOSC domain-containing protein [Pseudalkalibacillus caeni]|uniref:MOSC domain-containing protein n=1 Tax=Exobacillus caeni TaxID=2574798 RepID=A0A5R9FDV5_9BACL|nr:MOSC domain-containing protein [Pseudalkalibacillus caeni]TLS38744.1 MOSC domain-containing protein [Pseudalkalibacillus caeni]